MRVKVSILASIVAILIVLFGLAAPAAAEEEVEVPTGPWQVRLIPTPVKAAVPSFISADGDLIAWTAATSSGSSTYVFDLTTGRNSAIPHPLPGSYFNPSISGSKVAFQGGRTGAFDDVFVYDVDTETLGQVTFNSATGDWHDWDPRVLDDRVVWEKNMLGTDAKPGIYLHDLSTGTTSLVLEGDDYRDPDIWGDYLVCVKNVSTGSTTGPASEVFLYNLVTKAAPKSIADSTKSNEHPRISEGRVVYSSGQPWTPGAPDPWRTQPDPSLRHNRGHRRHPHQQHRREPQSRHRGRPHRVGDQAAVVHHGLRRCFRDHHPAPAAVRRGPLARRHPLRPGLARRQRPVHGRSAGQRHPLPRRAHHARV